MGVYIRGIEMPKNCEECNFKGECRDYWAKIREAYTRPSWCPLVEVADRKTEPKHGEWIFQEYYDEICGRAYECSICGAAVVGNHHHFCPNCGARMFAKDTNVPNKEGADDEHDR